MKILYAYNFYKEHGGENQWFSSEPELFAQNGHEVKIFEKNNKDIDSFNTFEKAKLFWEVSWNNNTYIEFSKILKEFKPDIVHVYNIIALLSPSIFYACKDNNVPVVQTLYNYRILCPAATFLRNGKVCTECVDKGLFRSVINKCYRNSHIQTLALARMLKKHYKKGTWKQIINQYIVPTKFMKELLVENGFSLEQISVKPNFHEPDIGLNYGTKKHFIYIGRLSEEKGIRTLLNAWKTKEGLAELLIIGDGQLSNFVESDINNEKFASKVKYLGRKKHEDVIEYLKNAIALIVPSEWYEAFPHTILEAYSCGIPVIASRIGTLKDVIFDNKTGFLFNVADYNDLAEKAKNLMIKKDLVEIYGANAREEYLKKYTGRANYENLLNIYNKVIKKVKKDS